MIRLLASSVSIFLVRELQANELPFHSWEPRFKTNAEKYRAILLDIDFEEDPIDTWAARRSFQSHFLMRTSAIPLGPGLNSGSISGILDQHMPLVGYDMIQATSPRGYWPLFASPSTSLVVDQSTSHWVNVYSSSGAQDSVTCESGEVIIGIRYSSHTNAAKFAPNDKVLEIPDIQCARLVPVAQLKAVDINSVDKRSFKNDSSGGGTITTVQSVMNVKQCMLDKTSPFTVKDKGATMNTCSSRGSPSTTNVVTGNVLLFEYLLSLRPDLDGKRRNPDSPLLLDFLVRLEKPVTSEDLFGDEDKKADDLLKAQIAQSKNTAVGKIQEQYKSNFGSEIDVNSVISELGDKPWSSDKLIAGSAEFITGTLTSGTPIQIIRGFRVNDDPNFPVQMICGSVIGCAHGTCQNNKCVCQGGFSGAGCTERLDPCGDSPCGLKGRCTENFNSTDGTSDRQYKCTCDEGFFGENCEKASIPCLVLKDGLWQDVDCGQGTCVSSSAVTVNTSDTSMIPGIPPPPSKNGYICQCNPGYTLDGTGACNNRKIDCIGKWTALALCDANCQQQEVFKIMTPAEGSGVACTNIEGDSRSTMCNGGNCKKCMSRDCNGRGKCSDAKGVCVCQSGWTGDNCEQSTSICATTLCNGRGNCDDTQSSCTCVNGWRSQAGASGKFCDIDPCAGCPPGNCNLATGTCACPDELPAGQWPACSGVTDCQGHWGTWSMCSSTCERKRYYTIDVPPANGGQMCPNKVGDFTTEKCTSGTCCSLQATDCQNGADFDAPTCTCRCRPGFQGDRCENKATTADAVIRKELAVDAATMALFNTTARPELDTTQAPLALAAEATTPAPQENKITLYIAAGGGGLLVIAAAAYFLTKKKKPAGDPLLAGMEGMEGMDLSGMDLSALGMDPAAANANPL